MYSIHLHIYFVTKYRRKMLSKSIGQRVFEVAQGICKTNKSLILQCGAELDHIHFLIDLHPDNNISVLVKSLKSATSQMVQKEFPIDSAKPMAMARHYGEGKKV